MILLKPCTTGSSTSCTQWFCHQVAPSAMGMTPSTPRSSTTAYQSFRPNINTDPWLLPALHCPSVPWCPVFLPTTYNSMIHPYRKPPAFIYLQPLTPCGSSSSFGKTTASVNLTLYPLCPLPTRQATPGTSTQPTEYCQFKVTSRTSSRALLLSGHPSTVQALHNFTSRLLFHALFSPLRHPAHSFPSSLSTNNFAWCFTDTSAAIRREFPSLPAPTLPNSLDLCLYSLTLSHDCGWNLPESLMKANPSTYTTSLSFSLTQEQSLDQLSSSSFPLHPSPPYWTTLLIEIDYYFSHFINKNKTLFCSHFFPSLLLM